jgi:hypothetical protein
VSVPHNSIASITELPENETRIVMGDHVLMIERTAGGGLVRLLSPNGAKPLEIEITSRGPVLRLGNGLAISVAGKLDIAAEEISLCAQRELALRSEGTMHVQVQGDMTAQAEAHLITARLGDVKLEANDDVIVTGERIRMNC